MLRAVEPTNAGEEPVDTGKLPLPVTVAAIAAAALVAVGIVGDLVAMVLAVTD